MGGREGGEEEMGRPLHILAQIISEQLRSAVISHRCAEAVCAEGESGDTRINEDNSRATDGTGHESAEGFTKEAEGWVRPKGTLGDPTAPTPFLAPTPQVSTLPDPFCSPVSNLGLQSFLLNA